MWGFGLWEAVGHRKGGKKIARIGAIAAPKMWQNLQRGLVENDSYWLVLAYRTSAHPVLTLGSPI